MVEKRPEELCPGADRAFVVAKKRANARGAKGGRKVETTNKAKKEKSTVNVLWTQSGEEQREYAHLRLFEQCLLAAPVTGAIHCSNLKRALDASANLLWRLTTNWRAGCKKFACPVRREGRSLSFVPTPILSTSYKSAGICER